jgi:hypothetical protein
MLLRRFALGLCVAGLLASCSGKVGDVVTGGELFAVKEELSTVKEELLVAEDAFVAAMEIAEDLETRVEGQERRLEEYEDFADEVKELYDALYLCQAIVLDFMKLAQLELDIYGEVRIESLAFLAAEHTSKCGPWAKQHDDFDWSP